MNYFSPVFRSSAVTKYGFGRTAMITVTDPAPVDYVQLRRDAHVLVLRQVANPDIVETFTQDRFHALVEAGKVKVDPKRFDTAWQEVRALNPDLEEKGLSGAETDELECCRRIAMGIELPYRSGEISLSDKPLKAAIAKVHSELVAAMTATAEGETGARQTVKLPKVPSPGTVRRWRRRLLLLNGNRLALRDRRHATSGHHRVARIEDPLVLSILAQYTKGYLSSSRPTIAHQHRLMRADIADRNKTRAAEGLAPLVVPSRSTLERSVRKLDRLDVILAREGEKAAKRALKVSGRQELATRPGERVAIDNWRSQIALSKLPAWIWDGIPEAKRKKFMKRGRLNFGFAICQATKIVLGVDISANPNAAATLRILQMVCQNKTAIAIAAGCSSTWDHTVTPEIVPFDNGSEFANEINGNAVRELGAEIEFGIAGEPNGRPVVERFLRTLDTGLLPFFTGRTFANIVERGDYNPQEMASVLVDVMSKALVRWVVDVYHNEPHAGLGGETPNDAWERCCEESGAMPPPDAERMRAIFGHMSKRRIGNRGIRHLGLYYKNRATGSTRAAIGQGEVFVKADIQNLGAISMRTKEPGSPWITVPCEWEEFEGVSAEQWLGVARDLRHKHANAAKLREETVLAAIRDLDKMGRDAAEAAGVGPVYLTDERLRQSERDIFNAFDTVRTPRKGVAGWASRGEATDRDGVAGEVSADAAPAVEPAPSPEDGRNPIQRRRRGLGPSILKGE